MANWVQGSNINPDFRFGGLLIGSYASVSLSGYAIISAGDAFSSTYGITMASALLLDKGSIGSGSAGFKFIPIAFQDISGGVTYHLSVTGALAGDDSVVIVAANSASALWSGAGHFIFAGFIVSAPFSFK